MFWAQFKADNNYEAYHIKKDEMDGDVACMG